MSNVPVKEFSAHFKGEARKENTMNKLMSYILPFCALALLVPCPVLAAGDDGGFGDSFTAQAPAALSEDAARDYSGETLSTIEPAAGESVWISPDEDAAAVAAPGTDILSGPAQPLVPGMEIPSETVQEKSD